MLRRNGMLKVLVTGANGFVGTFLCRRLTQAGYFPRAGVRSASQRLVLETRSGGPGDFAVLGDVGRGVTEYMYLANGLIWLTGIWLPTNGVLT